MNPPSALALLSLPVLLPWADWQSQALDAADRLARNRSRDAVVAQSLAAVPLFHARTGMVAFGLKLLPGVGAVPARVPCRGAGDASRRAGLSEAARRGHSGLVPNTPTP